MAQLGYEAKQDAQRVADILGDVNAFAKAFRVAAANAAQRIRGVELSLETREKIGVGDPDYPLIDLIDSLDSIIDDIEERVTEIERAVR